VLLLRTICCKIRSSKISIFDASFASRRRKRITPVAEKKQKQILFNKIVRKSARKIG
jgi:hypothetical protein